MIPLDTEEWKTVIYDGEIWDRYEVSSHGRVRSLNYRKTGQIKILNQHENNSGYLLLRLVHNGKRKLCLVHRLVAETFIPNPNNYSDVNHINENKHDNRIENLEWLPHKKNMEHGTCQERKAKSQGKRVRCVETGEEFESCHDVERKTGLAQHSISKACRGILKTCGKLHWEFVD